MTGFISTSELGRRQWWGFTDLGPNQIPPQPYYTVLTDRADGVSLWFLTFQTGQNVPNYLDQLGTIAIITPNLNKFRDLGYGKVPTYSLFPGVGTVYADYMQVYYPENEPWLSNMPQGYAARLFVRSAVLGVEIFADNDPLYTAFGDQSQVTSPMIYALPQSGQTGFGQTFRQISWSDNTHATGPTAFVGWKAWTITQTPNPPNVNSMANLSNPKADV